MYREMSSQSLPGRSDSRWFHAETVTNATSEPVIIPSIGLDAVVAVTPGASASVQFSVSSYEDIEQDTATWYDWPAGSVTAPTADSIVGGVTALRLVSSGTSSWEIAL